MSRCSTSAGKHGVRSECTLRRRARRLQRRRVPPRDRADGARTLPGGDLLRARCSPASRRCSSRRASSRATSSRRARADPSRCRGRRPTAARRRLRPQPERALRSRRTVVVRDIHPAGHTRVPRYVRGKRGVVVHVAPKFSFPDAAAHGLAASRRSTRTTSSSRRASCGRDAAGHERERWSSTCGTSYLERRHERFPPSRRRRPPPPTGRGARGSAGGEGTRAGRLPRRGRYARPPSWQPAKRRAGRGARVGGCRRIASGCSPTAPRACAELGLCGPAGRVHRRAREHPERAQRDRVHAVLVHRVARARAAARLVQEPRVSRARRAGAAAAAARDGTRATRDRGDPRLGYERGDALSGAAAAAGRNRRVERGASSRRSSRARR